MKIQIVIFLIVSVSSLSAQSLDLRNNAENYLKRKAIETTIEGVSGNMNTPDQGGSVNQDTGRRVSLKKMIDNNQVFIIKDRPGFYQLDIQEKPSQKSMDFNIGKRVPDILEYELILSPGEMDIDFETRYTINTLISELNADGFFLTRVKKEKRGGIIKIHAFGRAIFLKRGNLKPSQKKDK